MVTHVLIPGTFDPPTLGHLDLFRRAARLFDRVTIGLAEHPTKEAVFSRAQRAELLAACVAMLREDDDAGALGEIVVEELDGLVVDACERLSCDAIVRGVRSGTDYDYEAQMAATNHALLPRIDTVLLSTTPSVAHITSTLVRQIGGMKGDVSALVVPAVAEALRERFA